MEKKLIEKLAKLEHDQWMSWAKSISPQVSEATRKRWEKYFVAYDKLTEEDKELDRMWAKQVIEIFRDYQSQQSI